MKISNKINSFRRSFTKALTQNVGKGQLVAVEKIADKSAIKNVLISRPNGRLGNLLLITPLIQEVIDTFPNAKIDIFVKGGLAPIVFENYGAFETAIPLPKKPFDNLYNYFKVWLELRSKRYDLAINVDQNSSSGRLAVSFSKSKYKFFGDNVGANETLEIDHEHIAKYPVYNLRNYLSSLGVHESKKIVAPLDLQLSQDEIEQGKTILETIADPTKKTICLFTFATGAKLLPESWWEFFYSSLKQEFSNCNIIEILPVENVSQIKFEAPSFYSKDIREMGAVIANCEVFIGADSGIMHLASAVHTPTIGLFSVSNIKKYEPYDNGSCAVDTTKLTVTEYFEKIYTILDRCRVKKFPTAYKITRPVKL